MLTLFFFAECLFQGEDGPWAGHLLNISSCFSQKLLIFFLFHGNVVSALLEVPHRGASNEYLPHMLAEKHVLSWDFQATE